MADQRAEIGVFGGSGFYSFLDHTEEVTVETPYGDPSAPIVIGDVGGRSEGECPTERLTDEHHSWVQVVNGTVTLNSSSTLSTGDGAAMSGEKELVLKAEKESEVLVFELG